MSKDEEITILKRVYYNEVYSSDVSKCPDRIREEAYDNTKDEMVLCTTKEYITSLSQCMNDTVSNLIDREVLYIENRKDVEYHSNMIQLVAAAFIHTGKEIILLKTKNESVTYPESSYTLVQGHMNLIDRNMTLHDTILENMMREIYEEADIPQGTKIEWMDHVEPVRATMTACNRSHIGFIVQFNTNATYIKTNEPEKHDVVFINKDDLFKYFYKLCPWVVHCISTYDFFKN